MSVRRIKLRGTWVYQARIAYQKVRRSVIRPTREAALEAELALLRDLKAQAHQDAVADAKPATVRLALEMHVEDLAQRGKATERAVTAAHAVERLMPTWLETPVTKVTARDVFAYRHARERDGATRGTANRDLRVLRAALKPAGFTFPGGVFLPGRRYPRALPAARGRIARH
jgi:hypothetical protein